MDDQLEAKGLRVVLEGRMGEISQRIALLKIDKAVREKALRIAETGALRAGRYSGVRDDQGRTIDFTAAGKNQLKRALAQLDFDLELLELEQDAVGEALAELPRVGGDDAEQEERPIEQTVS